MRFNKFNMNKLENQSWPWLYFPFRLTINLSHPGNSLSKWPPSCLQLALDWLPSKSSLKVSLALFFMYSNSLNLQPFKTSSQPQESLHQLRKCLKKLYNPRKQIGLNDLKSASLTSIRGHQDQFRSSSVLPQSINCNCVLCFKKLNSYLYQGRRYVWKSGESGQK